VSSEQQKYGLQERDDAYIPFNLPTSRATKGSLQGPLGKPRTCTCGKISEISTHLSAQREYALI
jgi:hypothetical protein